MNTHNKQILHTLLDYMIKCGLEEDTTRSTWIDTTSMVLHKYRYKMSIQVEEIKPTDDLFDENIKDEDL